MKKNKNIAMALCAMVVGIVSVPVAAMVNVVAGLVMMTLPLYMIYKAG